MRFGYHVSSAHPISDAPLRAHAAGCEVFQMFVRSPRGGTPPTITQEMAVAFRENMERGEQEACYVHAPYFINFASVSSRIRQGSLSVIREDLERASALGATALMTHLGSAKDAATMADALTATAKGIAKALTGYKGTTRFSMEISAGAGAIIGSRFEHLAAIIAKLPAALRNTVGITLDTCHMFASGYDLRSTADVRKVLRDYEKQLGYDRLVLIHANDSMFGLGEKKDRHDYVGKGNIGLEGFNAIIHHPKLQKTDMVLEVPEGPQHDRDIEILKRLRASKIP